MKYKIEELKDITDSREIMQSKPQGFSKYMMYIIIFILSAVVLWSLIATKEISIKANGVVKPSEEITKISSTIIGKETTNIEKISVDGKVSEEQGTSFYTGICKIPVTSMQNKKGTSIDIKNGMLVQARIINREVSYFRYFLEKINILD